MLDDDLDRAKPFGRTDRNQSPARSDDSGVGFHGHENPHLQNGSSGGYVSVFAQKHTRSSIYDDMDKRLIQR